MFNRKFEHRRRNLKDFAISKKIGRQRISEFCKKNEYFSFIYSLWNDIQESKLFKFGLVKKYNASLPIFALKNICKWKDNHDKTLDFPEKIKITLPSSFGV